MNCTTLSNIERKYRSNFISLLGKQAIPFYSWTRQKFLHKLHQEIPEPFAPPQKLKRVLWNLSFRTPLFNAAGMYKTGEGFSLAYLQGAGAYLAGTATEDSRVGNTLAGVYQPFLPLPKSHAGVNSLGLPNPGHDMLRYNVAKLPHDLPKGVSIALSTDSNSIVQSMHKYLASGINFFEINISCPNAVEEDWTTTRKQIQFLGSQIGKKAPIIVKVSNDISKNQLYETIDLLLEHNFGGINIGNTSTSYTKHESSIHPSELKIYRYMTSTIGGGLSGKPLKSISLHLCDLAANYVAKQQVNNNNFHILRTGGIQNAEDLKQSDGAGVSLNMWFTGYFEAFAQYGHNLYRKFFAEYTNN